MLYTLNKKSIKQSITNLSSFFKEKGHVVPLNVIQDGFAKAMFQKNWNTLNGIQNGTNKIAQLKNRKTIILEIETSIKIIDIKSLIENIFKEANCVAAIDNLIIENNKSFSITVDFIKNSNNFLTAMILLSSELKSYGVKRFEMLRINIEKEDLLGLMKV